MNETKEGVSDQCRVQSELCSAHDIKSICMLMRVYLQYILMSASMPVCFWICVFEFVNIYKAVPSSSLLFVIKCTGGSINYDFIEHDLVSD